MRALRSAPGIALFFVCVYWTAGTLNYLATITA